MSLDPSEPFQEWQLLGAAIGLVVYKPHSSENRLFPLRSPGLQQPASLHTPPSSQPELVELRVDEESWSLVSWACWCLSLRNLEGECRTWLSWLGALRLGSVIELQGPSEAAKAICSKENWCQKQRSRDERGCCFTASAPAPHSKTLCTLAPLRARGPSDNLMSSQQIALLSIC